MVKRKQSRKKKEDHKGRILIIGILVIASIMSGLIVQVAAQLPDIGKANGSVPFDATIIYSSDGQVLGTIHGEENRIVVNISKISKNLQNAVIAAEDNDFYTHKGISIKAMLRAGIVNLLHGRIAQGGSTITQQLARTMFLNRQKTASRKISEIFIALQLEKQYTKEEILEMYLNQVYWGHNSYGAEAASELYFGKHADQLTLPEAALMAGILGAPEVFSPYRDFNKAATRRDIVLNRMESLSFISKDQMEAAKKTPISLSMGQMNKYRYAAPYFTTYVISKLIDKYGRDIVYKGGLKVYTTLNSQVQKTAEDVTLQFIKTEGPKYKFSECAVVVMDPLSGKILAMIGGEDFDKSEFNRATQAKRSPGSSFKPFVYTAAMEKGISPGDIIYDTPTTFDVFPDKAHPDGKWKPYNFDKKFKGPVTVRFALENSLNIPSIKLLQEVGPENAVAVAKKMGITSELSPTLSLTLGTSDVSLLEMVSAYSVFADNGFRNEPLAIEKVVDRDGRVIEQAEIKPLQVLDPQVNAVMVDMMKGVVSSGTGRKANIKRPQAAKTGTSERFRDAWFIGFVPQLTCGVWVGNDNNSSMKGVAEVGVCPRIWKGIMEKVLENIPVQDFPKPENLVSVKVCLLTGKLAGPSCTKVRWATYWNGKQPTSLCPGHNIKPKEPAVEEETVEPDSDITNEESF